MRAFSCALIPLYSVQHVRMKTFTEGLKTTFLDELRDTANVTLAARAAGISSGTAYKHRREDVLFAERWDEALAEAVDLLEHEAHRRAFKGVEEPVFYQGQPSYMYETNPDGTVKLVDEITYDDAGKEVRIPRPMILIDPQTGRPKLNGVRKYSDSLAMFLLKAHRPDKYRERSEVKQEVTGSMQLNDTTRAARLAAFIQLAQRRAAQAEGADDTSDLA